MKLPTTKREPLKNLSDYNILLYGAPKVGKSTFISHTQDPLFLATEPGLKALSVYEVEIHTWEQFLEACAEISQGKHSFKTIAIDTVDNLHKCFREYMLPKLGIQHESDMPYGKGHSLVKDEFMRPLRKLSMLPYGLILTSWAKLEEVKTRSDIYHRAVPTLQASIREMITGWVDIILYAETLPGGERVLHTRGGDKHIAGDRTESAFGRALPERIPLDYKEFEIAFYGGEIRNG